tara:strand:+ start:5430 stop:5897 length:468 start_codon:yes stop_codon:yes gene_type:complete
MSTEVYANDCRLWEIRFHSVDLDIPSYEEESQAGRVFVETSLQFGMEDGDLYCSVTLTLKLIKGEEGEIKDEDVAAKLKITATGRFELPQNHGLEEDRLNNLTDDEVRGFNKIMEPPLILKAKAILSEAGLDGRGLPLQLEPLEGSAAQDLKDGD